MTGPLAGPAVAVVVARHGRLPAGAAEAAAEAGGRVVLVGSGVGPEMAAAFGGSAELYWAQTGTDPSRLASVLAPGLDAVRLVLLPASPDGRDLAPHLARRLRRPLLAGAVRASVEGDRIEADLLRVDGRVVVPAAVGQAAVATLWPGSRPALSGDGRPAVHHLDLPPWPAGDSSVETLELVEPDPTTMDLGDAERVLAGGAGLIPQGSDARRARALFELLIEVAGALGASAGATRVVTDAGWMDYDRQIGTTGVTIRPDLYVALGISGASQHVGGIGDPACVVSVNLDPSCPMTGLAELGMVADATGLLLELAGRLGVAVPDDLLELTGDR
ncbi:MAG: mycofactocin-associated electron transfer flavoprotein alpha subunit [Actinomycetota bacterium]|nr:mycofactocin-associated electron transfer flavoprotein alpha subunit [Actinomycetota bacterium]